MNEEQAWFDYNEKKGSFYDSKLQRICYEGFSAGFKAGCGKWHKITNDADLPKKNGTYLWQRHEKQGSGVEVWNYLTEGHNPFYIVRYVAWREIPELYKEDE